MDPPEKMDCKANGEVILGVQGPSQPHLRENLLPAINMNPRSIITALRDHRTFLFWLNRTLSFWDDREFFAFRAEELWEGKTAFPSSTVVLVLPLCARSSEACCLFMPRLTVAHVMDEEAHTLVVCRVEPEHAGKNVIGFFEPAEPPQTETIAI